MTPMLYPAGNADPRQQVAPPSTSNGVHPPGLASCALLYSYKRNYVDQKFIGHIVRKVSLILSF